MDLFVTTPVRYSTEEGLSPHSHITEAQRLHRVGLCLLALTGRGLWSHVLHLEHTHHLGRSRLISPCREGKGTPSHSDFPYPESCLHPLDTKAQPQNISSLEQTRRNLLLRTQKDHPVTSPTSSSMQLY